MNGYLMQELAFNAGDDVFIESFSSENRYGVVFEDDGETGYFYAVEKDEAGHGVRILDALHIYEAHEGPDEEEEDGEEDADQAPRQNAGMKMTGEPASGEAEAERTGEAGEKKGAARTAGGAAGPDEGGEEDGEKGDHGDDVGGSEESGDAGGEQGNPDAGGKSNMQIVWSKDWLKCALVIDGYCQAIFDFEAQGGYSINEFPEPNAVWTKGERTLTAELINRLF